jgi:hypothetical protein
VARLGHPVALILSEPGSVHGRRRYGCTGTGRVLYRAAFSLRAAFRSVRSAGLRGLVGGDMTELDVTSLRAQVRGPVFEPGDAGYADEVATDNLTAVHRAPVVVGAQTVDDVVAAIRFATANGQPVRVHHTGHGTATGATDGVLISTRRLDHLDIDVQDRTVRVGPGRRWGEVIDAIAAHGSAVPCGSSPLVGVIGYLLGGGLSPIGRTYGFAADYVTAMEVVTADGTVRPVTVDSEPDLFWALRGGRIGIGVVTSATLALFPLASMYAGGLFFAADLADRALRTWADWAPTLNQDMTTSIALVRAPDVPAFPPPLRNRFFVHIRVVYIGDDADGQAAVEPLRAIGEPVLDTIARIPFAQIPTVHNDPVTPAERWGTGNLLREFPTDAADALLASAGPTVDTPLSAIELRQLGGAFGTMPHLPDAVSGRDAAYVLTFLAEGVSDLFTTAVPAAMERIRDALAPWILRGPQVNFTSDNNDAAALANSWQQPTHRRLIRIKTAYDPADVFRFGAFHPTT